MAKEMGHAQPRHFQHDITRLNQLAEQVALFATVWLSQMMRASYLPEHAQEAYISYLAHNYSRQPPHKLGWQVQRLAHRLAEQYSTPARRFDPAAWVAGMSVLNRLPVLPTLAAERRFMRYLALRDLHEFISAFAASTKQRQTMRPWVLNALSAAMRQNQLEQAWDNSITVWDEHNPPRPRTIVRARLQPGLWQANSGDNVTRH